MNIAQRIALTALLALASGVHADDCLGLYKKVQEQPATSTREKIKAIYDELFSSGSCSSARTVATQALGRKRNARMQLEDKKPFNASAAQANFDLAMQDPAVQEQLAVANEQLSDPDSLQLYQATVFDAEGYYGARDLVVRQLQQKLGVETN